MSNSRKTTATCPCRDCGWPTFWDDRPSEWYMVTDETWEAAGMDASHIPEWGAGGKPLGDHYWLCIGCLEARLGRELTAADFTAAPVNTPMFMRKTVRLNNRLGRHD